MSAEAKPPMEPPRKTAHTMRLLALFALVAALPAAAQTIAVTEITVIDVATGSRQPNQTVIITEGRIAAMGPTGRVAVPAGAQRIRGRGKFLIPGLWDMHVHLSMIGRSALGVFLANGITGVRDMGGEPQLVLAWRDSVAAGTLAGPRIKAPGNIVESARWLTNVTRLVEKIDQPELRAELRRRFGLDTPESAARAVDSLARLGVDFIKIRNFPDQATYLAFAQAARRHGLPIAGHGPPPYLLAMASDSGFASFEHSLVGIKNDKLADAFATMPDSAGPPLIRRFAANGTAWDPTLVSGRARFVPDTAQDRMINDSLGTTDPSLRYVSPTLRRTWRASRALESASGDDDYTEIYQANLADVRRMADLGVLILAGTDVALTTLVPGFSLHDELELLVTGGGLTPREALAAATVNPARVLRLATSSGAVAPGMTADLLILDADPTVDIKATRAIHAVIAAGQVYDRSARDRLLAAATQ